MPNGASERIIYTIFTTFSQAFQNSHRKKKPGNRALMRMWLEWIWPRNIVWEVAKPDVHRLGCISGHSVPPFTECNKVQRSLKENYNHRQLYFTKWRRSISKLSWGKWQSRNLKGILKTTLINNGQFFNLENLRNR